MPPDADFRKLQVRDGVPLILTQVHIFCLKLRQLMHFGYTLPFYFDMGLSSPDAASRRNGDRLEQSTKPNARCLEHQHHPSATCELQSMCRVHKSSLPVLQIERMTRPHRAPDSPQSDPTCSAWTLWRPCNWHSASPPTRDRRSSTPSPGSTASASTTTTPPSRPGTPIPCPHTPARASSMPENVRLGAESGLPVRPYQSWALPKLALRRRLGPPSARAVAAPRRFGPARGGQLQPQAGR